MTLKHKKLISMLLVIMMVLSYCITSLAAESQVKIDCHVVELEKYISKNLDGTLKFDAYSAINNGHDIQTVHFISNHIQMMNYYSNTYGATIDDSFTLELDLSLLSTSKSGQRGINAVGESKVVTHWYGLTEIYMNSDETQQLLDNLNSISDYVTVAGFIGLVPSKFQPYISGALYYTSLGLLIYKNQIQIAASSGTGIIMYIQTNLTDGSQIIYFGPQ